MSDDAREYPHLHTERRRLLAPLHHALDELLRLHRTTLGEQAVLAVSGGPDSRALLEAWATWSARDRVAAHVVSVDHATSVHAHWHAQDVVARAHVLAFEGAVVRVRATKLDEGSLRQVRREALAREARRVGARVIVTAHHADDEAEGVLMAILGAGGGPEGAGMPIIAPFDDDGGAQNSLFIARPFLRLPKSTLALACTGARAFDVVIDARDARGIGKRATLRRHVLPHLLVDDTDVTERLARHAALLRENETHLTDAVRALVTTEHDGDGDPVVRVRQGPRAVVRRALKLASALLHGSAPHDPRGSARAVDALLDAFETHFGGKRTSKPGPAVDDEGTRSAPVKSGPVFMLAGVRAEIARDASGRGEIVLTRPCR